jgi:hypothetical protein
MVSIKPSIIDVSEFPQDNVTDLLRGSDLHGSALVLSVRRQGREDIVKVFLQRESALEILLF